MTNYYFMHHPNIRTLATLGDGSLTAASPKIWHDLLVVIRQATNVAAFKTPPENFNLFRKEYSC